MDSSPAPFDPDKVGMCRLVAALDRMRDAFTQVSLLLQDIQFEQDEEIRTTAEADADILLRQFRATGHIQNFKDSHLGGNSV